MSLFGKISVIGHLPVLPKVMVMPDCNGIDVVIGLPLAFVALAAVAQCSIIHLPEASLNK